MFMAIVPYKKSCVVYVPTSAVVDLAERHDQNIPITTTSIVVMNNE